MVYGKLTELQTAAGQSPHQPSDSSLLYCQALTKHSEGGGVTVEPVWRSKCYNFMSPPHSPSFISTLSLQLCQFNCCLFKIKLASIGRNNILPVVNINSAKKIWVSWLVTKIWPATYFIKTLVISYRKLTNLE